MTLAVFLQNAYEAMAVVVLKVAYLCWTGWLCLWFSGSDLWKAPPPPDPSPVLEAWPPQPSLAH